MSKKLPEDINKKIWEVLFCDVKKELLIKNPPKNIISTEKEQIDFLRNYLEQFQYDPITPGIIIKHFNNSFGNPEWLYNFFEKIYSESNYYHLQFHICNYLYQNNNSIENYFVTDSGYGPIVEPAISMALNPKNYEEYIFN